MDFHQAVEYVEESAKYKSFFFNHKEHYLAHGFITVENGKQSPWEIGYYSKKTEKIVVFVADEEVTQRPEEDAFRKEGHVPELEADEVNIALADALLVADKVHAEKHKAENVTKTLAIIQTIKEQPLWNITLITHAFTMINVRVDAQTGELLEQESSNIMNLGARI